MLLATKINQYKGIVNSYKKHFSHPPSLPPSLSVPLPSPVLLRSSSKLHFPYFLNLS